MNDPLTPRFNWFCRGKSFYYPFWFLFFLPTVLEVFSLFISPFIWMFFFAQRCQWESLFEMSLPKWTAIVYACFGVLLFRLDEHHTSLWSILCLLVHWWWSFFAKTQLQLHRLSAFETVAHAVAARKTPPKKPDNISPRAFSWWWHGAT